MTIENYQATAARQQQQLREKVWTFRTCRLISAFSNPLDYDKLAEYTAILSELGCYHEFPEILGYPSVIGDREIEDEELYFINGDPITEDLRGEACWYVTDGHHRANAACEANIQVWDCKLDYNCLTCQKELALW
jgi:hypothetical protein